MHSCFSKVSPKQLQMHMPGTVGEQDERIHSQLYSGVAVKTKILNHSVHHFWQELYPPNLLSFSMKQDPMLNHETLRLKVFSP